MATMKVKKNGSNGTPIADHLDGQQPPCGATIEQWQKYVAAVRRAEELGMNNPEMAPKPWENCSSVRML